MTMETTKPTGLTGNQNARKYEKRGRLNLTCEMADKNRWVKQAQKEGKTLAQWVSCCCNQHTKTGKNNG